MAQEAKILLPRAALLKMGNVLRRFIRQNGQRRLNSTGGSLPKGIDLRETGAMMRNENIEITTQDGVVYLKFLKDYAEVLEKRFHFAGVPPQRLQEFFAELAPIVLEHIKLSVKG